MIGGRQELLLIMPHTECDPFSPDTLQRMLLNSIAIRLRYFPRQVLCGLYSLHFPQTLILFHFAPISRSSLRGQMDHGELQATFPEALEYDEGQVQYEGHSEITLGAGPDNEEPTLVEERVEVRGNGLW